MRIAAIPAGGHARRLRLGPDRRRARREPAARWSTGIARHCTMA